MIGLIHAPFRTKYDDFPHYLKGFTHDVIYGTIHLYVWIALAALAFALLCFVAMLFMPQTLDEYLG